MNKGAIKKNSAREKGSLEIKNIIVEAKNSTEGFSDKAEKLSQKVKIRNERQSSRGLTLE